MVGPPREVLEIAKKWSEADRKELRRELQKSADETCAELRAEGLWDFMTEAERAFAARTALTWTIQQVVDASWRAESSVVLMWALKMIPKLPPFDTQVDSELLKRVPPKDIKRFVSGAELRPTGEIKAQRSLAELWHWRSREWQLQPERGRPPRELRDLGFGSWDDVLRETARLAYKDGSLPQIVDVDFPFRGKAYRDLNEDEWSEASSIAMERHRALNWLCGYAPNNQWDKTPTDT